METFAIQLLLTPFRLLAFLPLRLRVFLAGCVFCFFIGRAWEVRRYRSAMSPQKLIASEVNPAVGANAPGERTCHP
jgi:hypothetical protein